MPVYVRMWIYIPMCMLISVCLCSVYAWCNVFSIFVYTCVYYNEFHLLLCLLTCREGIIPILGFLVLYLIIWLPGGSSPNDDVGLTVVSKSSFFTGAELDDKSSSVWGKFDELECTLDPYSSYVRAHTNTNTVSVPNDCSSLGCCIFLPWFPNFIP